MQKIYVLYFLIFQFSHVSYGVVKNGIEDKLNSFEAYYQHNFQELVYAHTDKGYYLTGETAKFKVYCLEKLTSTPSELSKVAYIEILSEENVPQIQTKIELINGSGYGEIYIPTNINSGNYILRGYTRWMRNFGPESFFHSKITIINPFKKLGLPPIPTNEEILINIHQESDAIINGLETKIIFDIQDMNGLPVDLTGRLLANDTILIEEFEPSKNGIGSFDFYPEILNKYHVELIHEDGDTTKHKFPVIVEKGLAIQVKEKDDAISVDFFCNDQSIISISDQLNVIVHQHGEVRHVTNFTFVKGTNSIEIDLSILDDGIVSISLFKATGVLIRERKFFKYSRAYVPEEVTNRTKSPAQREQVTIDLSKILADNPVEDMDLSISIGAQHDRFNHQILNFTHYLLLENALHDVVYGIETFFEGRPEEVSKDINNLLIIHAKYNNIWQTIDENSEVKYIAEYRTPLITGRVKNKTTNEPAAGILTYLSIPGKTVKFFSSISRYDGTLTFEMEDFYGNNEIVIQNNYTKDSVFSIEIDDPFSSEYLDINLPSLDIDEQMEDWIKLQSQNMQIENAYRQYQPKLPLLTKIDSSSFYMEPDSRYYLDDYTRFIVMEEVMREYIAGIDVRKNRDGFHFMSHDIERNIIYPENPLMLLDGIPVFDANEIIALDPLKIEKIETVKRRFHKGSLDCQGIVNYTSYEGNLAGYTLNDRALVFDYNGLQARNQYFFPTYSSSFDRKANIPDYRNTLYWAPIINASIINNSFIEVYTSDYASEYEIRVEGINKNGKIFSAKGYINVVESVNN